MQICPFPPSEGEVPHRISILGSSAAFGLYAQHLLKACQLVGAEAGWLFDSIRSIARGLKRHRGVSFRRRDFDSSEILTELLAMEGLESPSYSRPC